MSRLLLYLGQKEDDKNDEYLNLFMFSPVHLPMVLIAVIPTPNRDEFIFIVDNCAGSPPTILKSERIRCNSSIRVLVYNRHTSPPHVPGCLLSNIHNYKYANTQIVAQKTNICYILGDLGCVTRKCTITSLILQTHSTHLFLKKICIDKMYSDHKIKQRAIISRD